MKLHHSIVSIVSVIISSVVLAQSGESVKPSTAPKKSKPYSINYASSPWNKDSKHIDSAYMFIRNKETGQLLKIQLEETEPDSSIFSGNFTLDMGGSTLEPQAFIPPESTRGNENAVQQFSSQITAGKAKPQPTVLKIVDGRPLLDVYDTIEQQTRAREQYKAEKVAQENAENAKLIKPKANEDTLEAARASEHAALLAKLALEATQREATRIKLEQLERQREEQEKKKQMTLAASEIKQRKKQAAGLVQQAMALYQISDFVNAEPLFRRSLELDPGNTKYSLAYGVTLYRVDKYDEALVRLNMAETTKGAEEMERNFYKGLIYFRLKELPAAKTSFEFVRQTKHPVLGPSSAFYLGVIFFSEENFDKATKAFEYVLDESQDPALDKKAEEYLEKIITTKAALKAARRRWMINANFGAGYDSNILNTPNNDSSAATPSNEGGLRMHFMGDADYRLFYKNTSEMSARLSGYYIYSIDDVFAGSDPLILTLEFPYARRMQIANKMSVLNINPGYETIFMDYDNSGTQPGAQVLTSPTIGVDLQVIMSDVWFSGYSLDIRQEDSLIADSADNNLDALKISLQKSETYFLDSAKKRSVYGWLGYTMNDADGKNKVYNKIDLGFSYTQPFTGWQNASWSGGLSAYLSDYPDGTEGREDTSLTFNYSVLKIINDTWNWSVLAGVGSNTSSVDTYTYDKYTVLGLIGYKWSE